MARIALKIITAYLALGAIAAPAGLFSQVEESGGNRSLLQNTVEVDTSKVYFVRWNTGEIASEYNDTMPVPGLYYYDPAFAQAYPIANLGNTGTAVRSLWWAPERSETGIRLGTRPYELYRWERSQFTYPKSNIPYTRVFAVQGNAPLNSAAERQQNTRFDILFTRPFGDRLDVFLDYKWMDFIGLYSRQRAKVGRLATGFNFTSENGRYRAGFLVMMNAGQWEENGGVVSDSLIIETQPFNIRSNVPVMLPQAQTRLQERQFVLDQRFSLWKWLDLNWVTHYYTGYRRHSDGAPNDALYNENLLIDDRGIRRFGGLTYLDNAFYTPVTLDSASSMRINVGVSHRAAWYERERISEKEAIQQLGAHGKLEWQGEWFDFYANGDSYLTDGLFNYRLRSGIRFKWRDIFTVHGSAFADRHLTALMDTDFTYNGRIAATHPHGFTNTQGLELEAAIKRLGLSGKLRLATVQGQVVFRNDLDAFSQIDDIIPVVQLSLEHKLAWGIFRMHNRLGYQSMDRFTNTLGLPAYYINSTARIEGYIFKRAMWSTIGFNVRYTPAFDNWFYMPGIGEWVRPEPVQTVPAFPLVNGIIQFRVDRFQGFILLENLYSLVDDQIWYTTRGYPMQDFSYKIGILWHFRN
jgi:hypothetical protein